MSGSFDGTQLAEGRKPDDVDLEALTSLVVVDSMPQAANLKASKLMWLTDELVEEAEAAWPGQADCIGNPPVYNAATLCAKITQLLPKRRMFYNIYQVEQYINKIGAMWGFAVKIRGVTIICYYFDTNRKSEYVKNEENSSVSPGRKRNRAVHPSKEVKCPFKIRLAFVNSKVKVKRWGHLESPEVSQVDQNSGSNV
jgi:hypothetical protein